MSAPAETDPPRAPEVVPGGTEATIDDADGVVGAASELCPYLIASEGDWRARLPSREHRCTAVDPPAPLAADKQRRLCLVAAHAGCATYLAARDATASDGRGGTPRPSRWPVARTAPVLMEGGGGILGWLRLDRSHAQAGLVILMIGAFLVLAVARLGAGSGVPVPSASPAASSVVAASPTSAPSSTTSSPPASPAGSAAASPASSTAASAAPAPASTTYRVKPGDTLSSIAARFATTTKAIQQLNGIKDPSLIRVGQLLKIPTS